MAIFKSDNTPKLSQVLVEELEPLLEAAKDSPQSQARLLYTRQRIQNSLVHKDFYRNITAITALFSANQEDFIVAKYYVKIHLEQPKDGFALEVKEAFIKFKEGERVNAEYLIKKHNYNKLNIKILLIKIKTFDCFYTTDAYQALMSQALRDVGTKGYLAPNVMAIMAEFNSKRGDHDKAQ
jgi:hypothetical protein